MRIGGWAWEEGVCPETESLSGKAEQGLDQYTAESQSLCRAAAKGQGLSSDLSQKVLFILHPGGGVGLSRENQSGWFQQGSVRAGLRSGLDH